MISYIAHILVINVMFDNLCLLLRDEIWQQVYVDDNVS